jgi:hypothetical protein
MQGTQIGLINIFGPGKSAQTRDGTAIGLVNIGSSGYFALYASDIFVMNLEAGTGIVKNRRVTADNSEKQIQNTVIYARNPRLIFGVDQWAIGYGLKKMFFNRSGTPGLSHFRFLSCGIDALHISFDERMDKELNLLIRPTVSAGSRLHPKNKMFFLFASACYNLFMPASNNALIRWTSEGRASRFQHAPGFNVGLLVQ